MKAEIELLHSQFNKAIYDQTLAENARIKADNDRLKEAIADSYKAVDEMEQRFNALEAEFETHPMAAEIARLKAEVERLRKHGDAMAEALEAAGFNNARDFWNAAKEGKGQP